jgi:hypothetical protein
VFIVELLTTAGKVCETFATYEEAVRRVELYPIESLISLPLIFQELPDGSQRLVREDGKPLQWHRLPDDRPVVPEEPVPLCDDPALLGEARWQLLERPTPQQNEWDDEPLPWPIDDPPASS